MRKIIKIGFPILCVAIIIGTFILLNNTTKRINKNKIKDKSNEIENVVDDIFVDEEIELINEISSEEAKILEVKNKEKAIELVKKIAPPVSDCYYTNEKKENENYLVAVRDNKTKEVKIYYSVDIQNEKIKIYEN